MFLFIEKTLLATYDDFKFKYISCFYLSLVSVSLKKLRERFKYISCFYLSGNETERVCLYDIQIHLMFLFIRIGIGLLLLLLNSNTSHVFIYPCGTGNYLLSPSIQIHLMFLFIFNYVDKDHGHKSIQIHLMFLFIGICVVLSLAYKVFKYISCFYLSGILLVYFRPNSHSNTSHVFIYLLPACKPPLH